MGRRLQGAVSVGLLAVIGGILLAVERCATPAFTREGVTELAQQALREAGENATAEQKVQRTVELLRASNRSLIARSPKWVFNSAGGALGSMLVLHASFSEYLLIFGTSVGTDGHSGRFRANDYFTILHGEQWAATAGSFTKDVYKPGDTHSLPAGAVEHYKMPGECWALEYAYGNIVTMMPFGLIEVFTSTLDFESMFDTIVESGSQMLGNLRQGKV